MEQRYITFKNAERETWYNRFTWRGIYGDNNAAHAINIFRFFKNTHKEETLRGIRNVSDFYKKTTSLANTYVEWCKEKESHSAEEYADLWNFFVGSIGEFFFTYLFDQVKSVICVNDRKAIVYNFNFVSPLLNGEKDWGIDLTGKISDKHGDRNCVIQVKFWNPFANKTLQMDVMQKAFAEGVLNNYISPSEDKNVVICWLGDEEDSVSHFLRVNEPLENHVVLIGKKALNATINDRDGVFWDSIVNNLTNFSNN